MANAFVEGRLPPSMRDEENIDEDTRESCSQLEAMLDARKQRRSERPKRVSSGTWDKALDDGHAMLLSGEWDEARPIHFVAAYALLHKKVYAVECSELTPQARLYASGAAARMLRDEFGDERAEMAEFLRWTWKREKEREAWRRAKNRAGGRIGWRLQFGGSLLTDYRLDLARRKR
jgi:hypothetical protein